MANIISQTLYMDKDIARKELKKLREEINFAEQVLDGKMKYCQCCEDYYLSRSFFQETETTEGKVCTYIDPINSGGNDYAPGYIIKTYLVCPKGHRDLIKTDERIK